MILIISIAVAILVRLYMYNRAEHSIHVKNLNIEQLK